MKFLLAPLLFLVLGLSANLAAAQTPAAARRNPKADSISRKWQDIAYAQRSPAQVLDIYLPDVGVGPFPVILNVHGGAWRTGDKLDHQFNDVQKARQRGYAIVTMNYRLSQEAIMPAQIHDVKAAIRWVRANAKTYKLAAEKMAVWGSSAGGHLVALAGTSGGVKELEDLSMGNATQSSRVQAVIDWFGPTDFLKMDEQLAQTGVKARSNQGHNAPNSPESQLIGKTITEAPELVKAANPETYISPDDPPFFIQHGTVDGIVSREQSVEFAAKLEKVIGPQNVTLTLLEGAGHGGKPFSEEANLNRVLDFLDRTAPAARLKASTQAEADQQVLVPRFERKGPLTVPVPADVEVLSDLQYGTGGGRALKLDVVKPIATSRKPRPALVWIHGGAWLGGNKEGGVEGLLWFAQQGYVCATVEYRLAKEATYPAQIHDVKAAIRYLRANADRFGLDPKRIGVWGSSAGAHLAALLGTSGDTDELDGTGGNPGVRDDVQAVVDWFAPTDLLSIGHDPADQFKHNEAGSPESKLIGGPVQENKEKAIRANPMTYITRKDPPFLVMHGDQDETVPIKQSEIFVKALQDAGVDVTYIPVPGGGHGKGFDTARHRQTVLKFLDKHLKK